MSDQRQLCAPARSRAVDRRQWSRLCVAVLAVAGALALAMLSWRWSAERRQRLRGLELAAAGDFAAAEPFLRRVYERDPEDAEVLHALALSLRPLGKPLSEAEPILTRWCELMPERPEPLRLRLDLWLRLSNHERALRDARRLLRLEPDDRSLPGTVVALLLLTENLNEAEDECNRALKAQPRSAELAVLRARIYEAQGRGNEAATALDAVLREHPEHGDALLLRAETWLAAQRHDQAVPLLRRVLASERELRKRQTARYYLARALEQGGDSQLAKEVLAEWERNETAQRLFADSMQQPDNTALRLKAAAALLDSEAAPDGMALLQRLLARFPNHEGARRLLAEHLEHLEGPALAARPRQTGR
jgi:predicted Zn-dependent protease